MYPRDTWWIRSGGAVVNATLRILRRRLRMHIHRTAALEAEVMAAGLRRAVHRQGIFWQVAVYERP